jgi:hypothetical protein
MLFGNLQESQYAPMDASSRSMRVLRGASHLGEAIGMRL